MKKLLLLSFLVSLFLVSQSNAQWWVDGGNLIWPYGDVTVSKNLIVNGQIVGNNSSSYKVYSILISQEDTFDPTVNILENTLGVTIAWIRAYAGIYNGFTLDTSGIFPADKTVLIIQQQTGNLAFPEESGYKTIYLVNDHQIQLNTLNYTYTAMDNLLTNTFIEIRVYQ